VKGGRLAPLQTKDCLSLIDDFDDTSISLNVSFTLRFDPEYKTETLDSVAMDRGLGLARLSR